jgi:hypothetical protein
LGQNEKPGLLGGEARSGGRLGQREVAITGQIGGRRRAEKLSQGGPYNKRIAA